MRNYCQSPYFCKRRVPYYVTYMWKKWSFWILIQLIAFFVMNPQVLLCGDVILFRIKYLHIHSWTALRWMLVWGANWLDYHTVVTSLLKVSGALTARGVTDTDFFFIACLCIFTGALKKRSPLYPTSRPFLLTGHTFLYSKQDSTHLYVCFTSETFPSLVTMLSLSLPSDTWFWSHHSMSEI